MENSSRSGSSLPSIERLTGRANWSSWKFAAKTFLQLEGLWDAIKPTPNPDGTFEEVDEKVDLRAKLKLILLVDPILYVHIEDAETARSAWEKLEKAFEDKGLTRQVGLLHKLIKSDLESCGSMEEYVNQVISTSNQLNSVGFKLPELWIGMILLAGLPDEYRPMIMALENSGVVITGDLIKTKLLQEQPIPSNQNQQAFATKQRFVKNNKPWQQEQQPKKETPFPSRGPKCRKCSKFGHLARDCRQQKKGDTLSMVLSTFKQHDVGDWLFDSAAYAHMTSNEKLLHDLEDASGQVVAANGGTMEIVASGTVRLQPNPDVNPESVTVKDVQLIPGLTTNLLSISRIVQRGYKVNFDNNGCKVYNSDGRLVVTGVHTNNQFKLVQGKAKPSEALACQNAGSGLWHRRLGHIGEASLKQLADGLVTGIKLTGKSEEDCAICPLGKQSKLPFPKNGHRATEVLEVVHTDISGPMETNSLGGNRFYITFIDDKTRRIFVYFLKTKTEFEVLKVFKNFLTLAERQTGAKLKTIRSDNGKEYTNRGFQDFLRQAGIRHETTCDYTPEQNGLAERANRTIVEKARCLLFDAKLSKGFWAEAVSTAVYLINRSPTRGHGLTPEEAWSGRKPNLSHLRIFGTKAMVQVPKQKRRKWDPKSREYILTGFDEETKGYRLYDPVKKSTITSREVIFLNEGAAIGTVAPTSKSSERKVIRLDIEQPDTDIRGPEGDDVTVNDGCGASDGQFDYETDDDVFHEVSGGDSDASNDTLTNVTVLPPRQTSNPSWSQTLRRSGREHALPGKYKNFIIDSTGLPGSSYQQRGSSKASSEFRGFTDDDDGPQVAMASLQLDTMDDPITVQEALSRDDRESWKRAMKEEFDALVENNTWSLVELP